LTTVSKQSSEMLMPNRLLEPIVDLLAQIDAPREVDLSGVQRADRRLGNSYVL